MKKIIWNWQAVRVFEKWYHAIRIDDDRRKVIYADKQLDLDQQVTKVRHEYWNVSDITHYWTDNIVEKDKKIRQFKNKISFNKYTAMYGKLLSD